jgi:hypothetical protein
VFKEEEWIKKGKKYKDVPQVVSNTVKAAINVPDSGATLPHLTSLDILILDTIQKLFPRQEHNLTSYNSYNCFNTNPSISYDAASRILHKRSMPYPSALLMIWGAIRQDWLDGSWSIADPDLNKGQKCFPLWIVDRWMGDAKMNPLRVVLTKFTSTRRSVDEDDEEL